HLVSWQYVLKQKPASSIRLGRRIFDLQLYMRQRVSVDAQDLSSECRHSWGSFQRREILPLRISRSRAPIPFQSCRVRYPFVASRTDSPDLTRRVKPNGCRCDNLTFGIAQPTHIQGIVGPRSESLAWREEH